MADMNLRAQLVLVADTYSSASGRARGTISAIILKRGSSLARIAAGEADVTTARFEEAMQWFSDNWPEGAEWPHGASRPLPTSHGVSPIGSSDLDARGSFRRTRNATGGSSAPVGEGAR